MQFLKLFLPGDIYPGKGVYVVPKLLADFMTPQGKGLYVVVLKLLAYFMIPRGRSILFMTPSTLPQKKENSNIEPPLYPGGSIFITL